MALSIDVPSLLAQIESASKNPPQDELPRKALYEAAQKLQVAVETPGDTIQRIAYLPVPTVVARIAGNLDLFATLTASKSPTSTAELVQKTKADPVLLRRILTCLASFDIIKEAGEDQWAATNITKTLSNPGLMAGINHNVDTIMPTWQALPQFLKETNYKNPDDTAHSAFQLGHHTDDIPMVWGMKRTENFKNLSLWMQASREGQKLWLDVFPVEQDLFNTPPNTPDTPVFVDVGGGIGQQCQALKARFPDMVGRVILQDLGPPISMAVPVEGVEKMVYDFWTPQPVKNARAYYFRNIMHDWADAKCIELLQNTVSAMGEHSVILIDDMVLPNTGVHWRTTQIDITMMSCLTAMERTEKQWAALMEAAGLEIVKVYQYTDELHDSVLVVVPKK